MFGAYTATATDPLVVIESTLNNTPYVTRNCDGDHRLRAEGRLERRYVHVHRRQRRRHPPVQWDRRDASVALVPPQAVPGKHLCETDCIGADGEGATLPCCFVRGSPEAPSIVLGQETSDRHLWRCDELLPLGARALAELAAAKFGPRSRLSDPAQPLPPAHRLVIPCAETYAAWERRRAGFRRLLASCPPRRSALATQQLAREPF